MTMTENEFALVNGAVNGDAQCFSELYHLYYQKIYAVALQTVKNTADAEDVLQATFIKAWQNMAKLQISAAFNTWIQRIAINECTDILRKRKPDISIDNDEDEDAPAVALESDLMLPETYAEQDDLRARLRRIIYHLSDVQRETIVLFYFNGLKINEIAEVMDCSQNTVKTRLSLARKSIKVEVEEEERKTGTKFYGVALLPFGIIYIKQLWSIALPAQRAAEIYVGIQGVIGAGVAAAGTAAASGAASSAVSAAGTTSTAVGAASAVSAVGAAGLSVGAKIVIGVISAVIVGGAATAGILAVNHMNSEQPPAAAVTETAAPTTEVFFDASSAAEAPSVAAATEPALGFDEIPSRFQYWAPAGGERSFLEIASDGSFEETSRNVNRTTGEQDIRVTAKGKFSSIRKVNDYTYELEVGESDSAAYAVGDTFQVFTPEAPIDVIPAEDFGSNAPTGSTLGQYYFYYKDDVNSMNFPMFGDK